MALMATSAVLITASPSGATDYDENNWMREKIEDYGSYPDLHVQDNGYKHAVHWDHENGYVRYGYYDGAAWDWENVGPQMAGYPYTPGYNNDVAEMSVRTDQVGGVHVVYYDYFTGDLEYAYKPNQNSGWSYYTICAGCGSNYNEMTIDGAGRVHVAYYDGGSIYYRYHDYNDNYDQWSASQFVTNNGDHPSIAVHPTTYAPYIAYRYDNGVYYELRYSYIDGAAWQYRQLDEEPNANTGYWPSIGVDANGYIHVAYEYYGEGYLKYATYDQAVRDYRVHEPAGDDWATYPDLHVDKYGNIHVMYVYDYAAPNTTYGNLYYAERKYNDPYNVWTKVKVAANYLDANDGYDTAPVVQTYGGEDATYHGDVYGHFYAAAGNRDDVYKVYVNAEVPDAPPPPPPPPPPPYENGFCNGVQATIDMNDPAYTGTGEGTSGNDVILGTPGPDMIMGMGGDDYICGGEGDDMLYGGDGNDKVYGDAGEDKVYGDKGKDEVGGGLDHDMVYGGGGADVVYGGQGDDMMWGNGGKDKMYGVKGDDTMYGGSKKDKLWAGDGNDTMYGNGAKDVMYGQNGNDEFYGGNGPDVMWPGPGTDLMDGEAGNDVCKASVKPENTCV